MMKTVRPFPTAVIGLLLAIGTAQPCLAQADTAPAATEMGQQPLRPAESIEALSKLREDLSAEAVRLQPTTQATSSKPTSQTAETEAGPAVAVAHYAALQALIAQIDRQVALRKQLAELKSPETIEPFANELTARQQRTKELEAKIADPPPNASEDEVKAAASEYQQRSQELEARTARQTERAQVLADGPQRRERAAAAAQKALARFQEQMLALRAQQETAQTAEERAQAGQQIRTAQLEASLPLFQEQTENLAEQRDMTLAAQEERRISNLQALVTELGDWKGLLQKIQARSERERIEAQRAFAQRHPEAAPPYALTYWKLRLVELDAREKLEEQEKKLGSRFSPAAASALQQTLGNERAAWTLLMESLQRRPSEQIRQRYRQVTTASVQWRQKLAQMRRLLDQSTDDQQDIIAEIDECDEQIRTLEVALNEQLNAYLREHPENARVQQYAPQYAQSKNSYLEQAQMARTSAAELTKRLSLATDGVTAFVADLQQYQSRLYWRYLFVPERPVWTYRAAGLYDEWRAEAGRHASTGQTLERAAKAVSPWKGAAFVLLLACVEVLAIRVRRRVRRYAQSLVQRLDEAQAGSEQEPASISARLHLLAARLMGRTAPLVWPAMVAAVFVPACDIPQAAALAVLGFVIAASVSEALIHTTFLPGRPRQRLLRCSNVVAAHYRRWAMALWLATVLLAPVPLVLWALDWSYALRGVGWNAYKMVALVIVLLFGLRRHLVLHVAGRPEQIRHRRIFATLSATYWLLWLGLAALLALELAGYDALVTYVVVGVMETIATVGVAQLVARYVADLAARHQQRAASSEPPEAAPPAAPTDEESRRRAPELGVGLAVGLFRWCVAAGALLLILRIWGITHVEVQAALAYPVVAANAAEGRPATTVGHVLLAILAVVIAWWVSRLLRSFLSARVYPTYAGIDRGARAAVNTMLHYFLVLLGLYFALFALHVPLGALTVVLGTLGLGVGLGLQPLFTNFISGLMILFERHVRVGDLITVGGELGEVTAVSIRSTTIKTPDGIELVIPNSDLITHNVVNWTLRDTRLRGHVTVGVAYGTDTELVRKLLLDIMSRHNLVLRYPPPEVWFMAFGDNSLDFELVAWFNDALSRWRFVTSVRFEIARVFREHGIEIPFPQRTLSTAGGAPLSVRVVHEAPSSDAKRDRPPSLHQVDK
jgi:small-conductance mechanosensitive channel